MMRALIALLIATLPLAFSGNAVRAQSPTPIIVQAATSAPAATAPPTTVPKDADADEVTIRMLRQMKAANEEILKKQEATLQRLDEIQKAAEQLKVFSKRG